MLRPGILYPTSSCYYLGNLRWSSKIPETDALHGTSDTLGQYETLNAINCGQYQTLTGTKPWLDTFLHLNRNLSVLVNPYPKRKLPLFPSSELRHATRALGSIFTTVYIGFSNIRRKVRRSENAMCIKEANALGALLPLFLPRASLRLR